MEDSIGSLTRNILYHWKSIEERLKWSKAINDFKQQDKQVLNQSILKVSHGINNFLSIVRNPVLISQIKTELNKSDLTYFMVLTEQLINLPEEDLIEVTDLIDNYLKKKYEHSITVQEGQQAEAQSS